MYLEPELGACSIVLVGKFNPAIFTPHWFALNKLITVEAADQAIIEVIVPDFSRLTIPDPEALLISVELNRFSIETTVAPWIRIMDMVLVTFGQLLSHTPVTAFGINRNVHFSVGDEATRNAIGNKLAPLGPWGAWGNKIAKADKTARGGVTNITLLERLSDGDFAGHVQAQVQPSTMIAGDRGIFMNVNSQWSVLDQKSSDDSALLLKKLQNVFQDSINNSEEIFDEIMKMKDIVAKG